MRVRKNKYSPRGSAIRDRLDFNSMPIPECGCQIWLGYTNKSGYGSIKVEGKAELVHRVAWKDKNGEIPDNLFVLHKCDVPSCFNEEHLFLGDAKINSDDMISKGRQVVLRGTKCGKSKISDEIAKAIYHTPGFYKDIARKFNVHKSMVSHIKANRTWYHATMVK